jgi:hypothetical protein
MTERCQKELSAVKKARSAKSRNHSVERYQKCLINVSDGKVKTGLKLNKKQKAKVKAGKKI